MKPTAKPMQLGEDFETVTVDQLFAAAFGKSRWHYQRKSLMGWRPVIQSSQSFHFSGNWRHSNDKTRLPVDSPDVKVRETTDVIVIDVTLPEIDAESLYLEVAGDLLIIRAQKAIAGRKNSGADKPGKRPMVHRYIKLPLHAQPGNVQAHLDGNVVRVKIRKPLAKTN